MRTLIVALVLVCAGAAYGESQVERRLRDALTIMSHSDGARGVDALVSEGPLADERAALSERFAGYLKRYGNFATLDEAYIRRFGRVEIGYFVVSFSRGVLFVRLVSLYNGSDKIVTDLAMDPRPEAVFPPALLGPDK
jgi:hypothetical protein